MMYCKTYRGLCMKKIFNMLILAIVMVLIFVPGSAYGHNVDKVEMVSILEEIIEIADSIHDESEYLADDIEPTVGLDIELMGKAEVVHGVSHDIDRFANIAVTELNKGLETGEFNNEEIARRITMLKGTTNAISYLIDDIEQETPSSHENYATNLKDDYDRLEELITQLNELAIISGLQSETNLDPLLMGKSEVVHGVSHSIGRFANIVYNELDAGIESGDFDEDEISRRINMINGVTSALSPLVSQIKQETPESHQSYATEIEEEHALIKEHGDQLGQLDINTDAEEMKRLADEIMDSARSLHDSSEIIADDVDPTQDEAPEEVPVPEPVDEDEMPGFTILATLLAVSLVAMVGMQYKNK